MLRFTRISLASVALLVLLSACKDDASSKAEKDALPAEAPPALAKPAGADDGKPEPNANATRDDDKADAPPTDKEDVAEEGDAAEPDDAAPPKRTAKKGKRVSARRRASSGADVDVPEAGVTPELKLKRIQLSQAVSGREPVDPDETFSARDTDSLYAFVEVQNPEKRAGKIFVSFVPPMGAPSKVTLKVGDVSRWRTWAKRKSPKAVGTWHVVVTDEKGRELGRRSFEVTE